MLARPPGCGETIPKLSRPKLANDTGKSRAFMFGCTEMSEGARQSLIRYFWDLYCDARRRRDLGQSEPEWVAAANEAASAWSGFIVAHNPHCPHCGVVLKPEGMK